MPFQTSRLSSGSMFSCHWKSMASRRNGNQLIPDSPETILSLGCTSGMPLKTRFEMSHELLKNEFVVYTARCIPRPVASLVAASTPGSTHGLCAPPPGGPMWKLSGTSSSSQLDRKLDHRGWFKHGRPWTSGALNMVGPAV